jgi:hypothetical protein
VYTRIRVYVYTCIRVYVYHVYVYTCIRVYVYTCIRVYVYTCIRVYVYTCIRVYMCKNTRICVSCTLVHVFVYPHARTWTHTLLSCDSKKWPSVCVCTKKRADGVCVYILEDKNRTQTRANRMWEPLEARTHQLSIYATMPSYVLVCVPFRAFLQQQKVYMHLGLGTWTFTQNLEGHLCRLPTHECGVDKSLYTRQCHCMYWILGIMFCTPKIGRS